MSIRLNNIGSILGSFLVLMFFGVTLAHDFAYIGYKLHPFLLAIAAAAIGYGLIEALFAFVLAVALYFAGLLFYAGTLLPQADPHIYILFSFMLTAVVLGMVQNSRIRQLMQARSELEEVRNVGERLRQRLQVVNTANQKLNERILGEVTTVQSFADIARRLSVLEEKDLYPALCDLLADFVHAQECSVYMLQDQNLLLKAQRGWSEVPQDARTLTRDKDLLWSALDQRRVVTPLDLDKMPVQSATDTARRHRRLICAPIFHPQSGQAMGVVSVDRLPFAHLHGNTLGMLSVIAKWAGDSLFNASSFQGLSRQLNSDELIPGCIPPILLQDRFQEAVRRGDSCSLVVVQLQGLEALDPSDQVWFRKTLSGALQPHLGSGVSLGRVNDDSYALLFLTSDKTQQVANEVVAQLKAKVPSHPQASRVNPQVGWAGASGHEGDYENTWRRALTSVQPK